MGGDEPGREQPPRGERHVLAEHDEHGGLEGVGAARHPQVRPGPHERPEHRVVGECGDTSGGVGVQPHPPAAGRDRRRHGIRLAVDLDDRGADVPGGHGHGEQGVPVVDAARAVGAGVDPSASTSTSSSPGTACATRNARSARRSTSVEVTR